MELQDHIKELGSHGVQAVGLLYDSPRALDRFTRKHRLTFPLVSDQGSKVIRELGLLNEEYDPETRYYGVPYPGIFLLDSSGTIVAKFAEMDYRERPLFSELLKAVKTLAD